MPDDAAEGALRMLDEYDGMEADREELLERLVKIGSTEVLMDDG